MKPSLSRLLIVIVAVALPSLLHTQANAQEIIGQDWFSGAMSRSDGGVNAMYQENAQLPLGGLFAPRFTRTLTILGGLNFPTDSVNEDLVSSGFLPDNNGPVLQTREIDDTGYAISFAFGRRHSHTLRSEIEVAVRGNDINVFDNSLSLPVIGAPVPPDNESERDGSITTTSLMKNFIHEFGGGDGGRFTPYAGVGLGISYVDVEFGEASSLDGEPFSQDDATLFTYQAIGGVATRINSAADFIVEYRFLGTSEVEFNGVDDAFTYNTNNLFFGVKFEY